MKKKLLGLTMAVMMAASLVACGSSESSEPASGDAGAQEEAAPAEEAETPAAEADAGEAAAGEVNVADLTIAYVPTTMNNPFWSAMMGGITAEMEAKGMDPSTQLVTVDADSDQATMNNYVYDLINQDVDAIILAPMDCTAVTEALQACADAGIPVRRLPAGVECHVRKGQEGRYEFYLNWTNDTAAISGVKGRDMVADREIEDVLELPAYGVAVVHSR